MPNNDYLDFLAHHGILGQKWGVRRYQNPDGSLTSAGVKRYRKTIKAMDRFDESTTKLVQLREKFNATNVSKKEKQKVFRDMKVESKKQNKAARKMFYGSTKRLNTIYREIKSDKEIMRAYKNGKDVLKYTMKKLSLKEAKQVKDTMECLNGFEMANLLIQSANRVLLNKDLGDMYAGEMASKLVRNQN